MGPIEWFLLEEMGYGKLEEINGHPRLWPKVGWMSSRLDGTIFGTWRKRGYPCIPAILGTQEAYEEELAAGLGGESLASVSRVEDLDDLRPGLCGPEYHIIGRGFLAELPLERAHEMLGDLAQRFPASQVARMNGEFRREYVRLECTEPRFLFEIGGPQSTLGFRNFTVDFDAEPSLVERINEAVDTYSRYRSNAQ